MIIGIGRRAQAETTAASLLLECHTRIRTLLSLAARLSEAAAGGAQVPEAAERVHRYFAIALPLHVADEDESVRPRLERVAPAAVTDALAKMSAEHDEMEALLGELNEKWRALADRNASSPSLTRPALAAFTAQMTAHLEPEEKIVFPALSLLPREQRDAIADEIRARRRNP